MEKSDQINELATALAKAQGELQAAVKDCKNPHYGNNYASLASVREAIRGPLSKHGLCVVQLIETSEPGYVGLTSMLMHTSGQYISTKVRAKMAKDDPQALGSATTYLQRYSLGPLVGIASEDDDDGIAASAVAQKPTVVRSSQPVEDVDSVIASISAAKSLIDLEALVASLAKRVKSEEVRVRLRPVIEAARAKFAPSGEAT